MIINDGGGNYNRAARRKIAKRKTIFSDEGVSNFLGYTYLKRRGPKKKSNRMKTVSKGKFRGSW